MPPSTLSPLRALRATRLPPTTSRALPRRYASTSYASQSQTGLVFGGLAVVGIVGWTALIFKAAPRPKPKQHHAATPVQVQAVDAPALPEPTEPEALPTDPTEVPPEDAAPQGAYDPVTGEINWACPCLGGMADGPCGEEFKLAFSCFVHSEDEPKGVDCVEKFRGMQECFRKHPDIYGSEAEDDEESEEELIDRAEAYLKLEDEQFLREAEQAANLE